jgi:hypothetical protein
MNMMVSFNRLKSSASICLVMCLTTSAFSGGCSWGEYRLISGEVCKDSNRFACLRRTAFHIEPMLALISLRRCRYLRAFLALLCYCPTFCVSPPTSFSIAAINSGILLYSPMYSSSSMSRRAAGEIYSSLASLAARQMSCTASLELR